MIGLLLMWLAVQQPGLPFQRPATPQDDLVLLQKQLTDISVDLDFWLKRINLYTEIQELEPFAETIFLLAERFPQVPVFLEAKMFILSQRGQHQEALALGQAIAISFPDYPSIRNNLGRIFARAGKHVEALNVLLAKLGQDNLRREDWTVFMKVVLNRFDSKQQLFKVFEEKLGNHPENLGLQRALLALYTRFGDYGQAATLLERYPNLSTDPELIRFRQDLSAALIPLEEIP